MTTDTIAAIATPEGQGGVGIIRISGPKTPAIALSLLGEVPKPRYAHFSSFFDSKKQALDQGLALYFKAPHSFTGEDVLELQGHGGPVILDMILQAVLQAGARLAEPGEFSKRAFLNDKIDLAQAEAIADLIASQSSEAARAAMRSLGGEFSHAVNAIVETLIRVRLYIEAAIDFPEEEIDFLSDGHILSQLEQLEHRITHLQQQSRQGALLREGLTVVITGQPNAGKSSLLNALSGEDSAIVTEFAGTTRDVLKEKILIDGIPLHILDTAGLRDSTDPIEQEGIRRAKEAVSKAQLVLLILDATTTTDASLQREKDQIASLLPHETPVLIVVNKIDLVSHCPLDGIKISAKTHQGLEQLKNALKNCAGATHSTEGTFLARRRHLEAIEKALHYVKNARKQLTDYKAGELVAEELRCAQQPLSEITGSFTSDDLLGRIFSSFCIGK